MIYAILNIILGLVMIYISFSVDKNGKSTRLNTSLVNLILFYSACFFMMGITLLLCLYGPRQLSILMGRFTFTVSGCFAVLCTSYALKFSLPKRLTIGRILEFVFYAATLYFIFIAQNGLSGVAITRQKAFQIASGPAFNGAYKHILGNLTWFGLYLFIYRFVIPFFTFLIVIVRIENTKDRIDRTNYGFVALGIVLSIVAFYFLRFGSTYIGMFPSLTMCAFLPQVLLFVLANENNQLWLAKRVAKNGARFTIKYLLPSIIVATFFVLMWPFATKNFWIISAVLLLFVAIVVSVSGMIRRIFHTKEFLRDNRYATHFEKEITEIDFTQPPAQVTDIVYNIFNKYVESESVKIIIDSGNGEYESVYSSDGEKYKFTINADMFDTLLNLRHPVVFREYIERTSAVTGIKHDALRLLDESNSDAFIILNEGRQIISILLLGKKKTGNVYLDYDYEVFNKYYSNLFVIGYYVKNIMNEDVVGTVNREINMSGQIITSIQENMDLIKNPKVDAGYLMVPAHNIGGEFVDFIRLTDTRHIFIIGALSGRGIAASMGMVILKSIIRTFLAETTDFKLLVEKVNVFIRESLPKGTFFAGTFGLLDFNTDTMYYINCGSPALFLYTRAYNNVIEIQGEGRVLGFAKSVSNLVKVKKVKLSEGDIVMACTDGLIESRSLRGDQFGKSRSQSGLMDNAGYPAQKMAKFTYDSLVKWTSKELEEDVTILILKYFGGK